MINNEPDGTENATHNTFRGKVGYSTALRSRLYFNYNLIDKTNKNE
jgi:hypothetical protein